MKKTTCSECGVDAYGLPMCGACALEATPGEGLTAEHCLMQSQAASRIFRIA